jgi:hypothetical protein
MKYLHGHNEQHFSKADAENIFFDWMGAEFALNFGEGQFRAHHEKGGSAFFWETDYQKGELIISELMPEELDGIEVHRLRVGIVTARKSDGTRFGEHSLMFLVSRVEELKKLAALITQSAAHLWTLEPGPA